VSLDPGEVLALNFQLQQNYPNPFNPSTQIRFALPSQQDVSFMVHDLLGRRVDELQFEALPAGWHDVTWQGLDRQGKHLPAGVYIGVLEAGPWRDRIKMVLLR
jgi:hypothetical protein